MEEKRKRMRELVEFLNRARRAYEQEDTEIISNYEYDRLYDELQSLEKELGTTLASSPTVNVGYEVLSELPKERHERPMLSLDKTKDVERLKEFLGGQKAMISWKLDGLTIVLTYREGELQKAVTRGNGEVGEVITNNAKVFQNLPCRIPYRGELVIRGEAVISYCDFEKINEEIEDVDARYKNPRNLCSGSVRQLNNQITAKRNVKFYAFTLVRAEGPDFHNSRLYQMKWLNMGGGHHITRADYDVQALIDLIKYIREKYDVEVYLEPGEAFALNAGYLITEVMDIVHNDMDILILDASAACHMPDVIEMPYRPPLRDGYPAGEKPHTYRLSSLTCLAGDVIGDYSFEKPVQIGDRLIFEDMAIYSMVKNNTFNGIPLPDIVLLEEDGSTKLIKRFDYQDFKERLS